MVIRLNRKKSFFSGLFIIVLYYFLNKWNILYTSTFVSGVVIDHIVVVDSTNVDHPSSKVYHAIIYPVKGEILFSTVHANEHFEEGNKVLMLYRNKDPKKVYIYTFLSFWYEDILISIFPIMLLGAACLSFIDKHEELQIGLGRDKGIRKIKPGKSIDGGKTDPEKWLQK